MHFGYVEYIFHSKDISLHIIFYSHLFVFLVTLIYLLDASSTLGEPLGLIYWKFHTRYFIVMENHIIISERKKI